MDNHIRVSKAVPWIECEIEGLSVKNPDQIPSRRIFKSHNPYHMMAGGLPHTSPAKYVYIARNPKDVAVSYFYHMRAVAVMEYSETWENFYKLFVSGNVGFGLWFDHVLEWWKHRDAENILFLKYEDMKKDHRGAVKKIASFMGYDLKEEVIDTITEKTTFQSMKANPATNFEWPETYDRVPDEQPFMRKGEVGDWTNHFTSEQNAEFDAVYAEKMKGSGLDFDFE